MTIHWQQPSFWYKRNIASVLLLPLAWIYQLAYFLRWRSTRPATLPIPILCIGNLVIGGAGKTPCALAIGGWLKQKGVNACFLSKGYGGHLAEPTLVDPTRHSAYEVGDEPLLLARTLPTIVAKNRLKGAYKAVSEGFSLIIMDDGFQNPMFKKDCSIIVMDSARGFGNRFTLPAGPLREPVESGLKRAQAIILTERKGQPVTRSITTKRSLPTMRAYLRTHSKTPLEGKAVVAFSGIARPQQFFDSLTLLGAELVHSEAFADHHIFSDEELSLLNVQAKAHGAILVTTPKDWVRLSLRWQAEVTVAELNLTWMEEDKLETLLKPLLDRIKN